MNNYDSVPTIDTIRKSMNISFIRLIRLIDTFTEQELTQLQDAGGWTVCDHLTHLSVWAEGIAALLRRECRWAAMGLTVRQVETHDVDFINDIIFKQNRTDNSITARLNLLVAHDNVIDAIEKLTDEALLLPYDRYTPPFTGDEGHPIYTYILSNTEEHYREHMRWIQQIVQNNADVVYR